MLLWLNHSNPPSTHPEPESVLCLELHFQDNWGNVISKEGQGLALVQCDPAVETRVGAHHNPSRAETTLVQAGGTTQLLCVSSLIINH